MLTKRQSDLLVFIGEYQTREGFSPSFADMAAGIGLKSKSGVHRLLDGLVERGLVVRSFYRARAIDIVRKPDQSAREAALEARLKAIAGLTILQIVEDPDRVRRMAMDAAAPTMKVAA